MNKKEKNKTSNSKINIFFKTIVFFLATYLICLIVGKLESIILKEPLKFSKINSDFIFFMAFGMPLSWLLNYSKKRRSWYVRKIRLQKRSTCIYSRRCKPNKHLGIIPRCLFYHIN